MDNKQIENGLVSAFLQRYDETCAQRNELQKETRLLRHALDGAVKRQAVLEQERDAYKLALESLTPGGSEFSGSIDNCVRWIRERLGTSARHYKMYKEQMQETEKLRTKLDNLKLFWDLIDNSTSFADLMHAIEDAVDHYDY